jgi:hypothetical protein
MLERNLFWWRRRFRLRLFVSWGRTMHCQIHKAEGSYLSIESNASRPMSFLTPGA